MLNLSKLEEALYLPLKAIWAAKAGLSQDVIRRYSNELLLPIDSLMPPLDQKSAIILGSTNATAFIVDTAVKAGHEKFVLVGNKPIGKEHPAFTDYVRPRLECMSTPFAADQTQTETQYAKSLLMEKYGIAAENITCFDHDRSTNTGANMMVLKEAGYARHPALEIYALAGSALRVLMTARKELGEHPAISVHNAYPTDVTPTNWFTHPVARAHLTAEAVKSLGNDPLYVRCGFAVPVNLHAENQKCNYFIAQTNKAVCKHGGLNNGPN